MGIILTRARPPADALLPLASWQALTKTADLKDLSSIITSLKEPALSQEKLKDPNAALTVFAPTNNGAQPPSSPRPARVSALRAALGSPHEVHDQR